MSPLVCSHEAAHAVVDWYLGFQVAQVRVLSGARWRAGAWLSDRRGKILVHALGHTELAQEPFLGKHFLARNGQIRLRSYAKARLAGVLAGPIMTAIDTNQSLAHAFAHGGDEDERMVRLVQSFAQIDQRSVSKIIESTALFLLSRAGARAKMGVANRLFSTGKVSGDQLDAICRAALAGTARMDLCHGVGLYGYIDNRKLLIPQLTRKSLIRRRISCG